ncbi:MAG: XisI protein [Spirulinaceae cyanobacterium]
MDILDKDRQIIYKALKYYADLPYWCQDVKTEVIVSEDKRHYLLLSWGWEPERRLHGCIVHIEIIENKIWIHQDGIEDGIANDLVEAGIPKNRIVLAFHPPEIRPHTEFAVS